MDTILIFFATFGVYLFIVFRKSNLYSPAWFAYLLGACCFLSFAICVKFVGIIWLALCLSIALYDYWWLLPNKAISSSKLIAQALVYLATFFLLPALIYLGVFYVHLSVLKVLIDLRCEELLPRVVPSDSRLHLLSTMKQLPLAVATLPAV